MNQEDQKLHEQFIEYGRNTRDWMNRCKLLLPEINRCGIWRKKGFSSLFEYAAKLAGMSRFVVKDALRICRRIEDKPALKRVALEKGLNRVRPVVGVATLETESFWAEKAREMGKTSLETFVREVKSANRLESSTSTENDKVLLSLRLPRQLVEKLKRCGDLEQLLAKFAESLGDDPLLTEKPRSVRTKSRHIPLKIKQHVLKRTHGRCAFPGCAKPYKIFHHTQRWALEKIHDPDRIVPLCKEHDALAHHNLIENEQALPKEWSLRLYPDRNSPEFWVDEHVALFRGT